MTTKREKTLMKVEVGPVVYTVKQVDDLHCESGMLFGICQGIDKEIQVRSGMQPKQELQTTLHELLHAIINEYAIRNAIGIEPQAEEVLVDLMALGLTHSLASSPGLRKYINDKTKPA